MLHVFCPSYSGAVTAKGDGCYVPFSPRKRVILAWDTARVEEVQLQNPPPGVLQATGLSRVVNSLALLPSLSSRFSEDAQLVLTNSY